MTNDLSTLLFLSFKMHFYAFCDMKNKSNSEPSGYSLSEFALILFSIWFEFFNLQNEEIIYFSSLVSLIDLVIGPADVVSLARMMGKKFISRAVWTQNSEKCIQLK